MMYTDQGGFAPGGMSSFSAPPSPDQELAFLKNQAEMLRQHLDRIIARVQELEESEGAS
jgi:hypothetical protein